MHSHSHKYPLGLKGQGIQSLSPSIPTSPQAEAFKQYGDYAINYSTGVPDISIPLYEINHRGYKLPLVLSYNPRPLKPGYNYDVYGHGWGLSVHSSISRTIESCPDEWKDFRIDQDIPNNNYRIPAVGGIPVELNGYNFARDKFNVILPNGSSFDFIIEKWPNNELVYKMSDGRHVKITCNYSSTNINSFVIIDEDGVKYTFDGSDTPYSHGSFYNQSYVSWQLTRIDLPHTAEPIIFSYNYIIQSPHQQWCYEPGIYITHYTYRYEIMDGVIIFPQAASGEDITIGSHVAYRMKLLSTISYAGSRISFTYDDQNPTAEYNYVNKITIRENSTLIREISLSKRIIRYFNNCISDLPLAKLDAISIKGQDLLTIPLVHSFRYHPVSGFNGTDHWGYSKGSETRFDVANFNFFVGFDPVAFSVGGPPRISAVTKSAQDLCPYDKLKLSYPSMVDFRAPDWPGNHGVLTRITYPTGGYTEFDFENHKFLTSTDLDGNYILNSDNRIEARAAGFRIRKIINYTAEGDIARIMNYGYGKTYGEISEENQVNAYMHTGLGEAVVDPNILTYSDYTFFFPQFSTDPFFVRNMLLGLNANAEYTYFSNYFHYAIGLGEGVIQPWKWECTFSPVNFRRIVNGRPPVLYPEVTVYYGEYIAGSELTTGKTVYKYQLTEPGFDHFYFDGQRLGTVLRDDLFFEAPQYFKNTIDYVPQDFRYNKLKEQFDYKVDGQTYRLVKKEVNDYWYNYQYSFDLIRNNAYPSTCYPGYDRIGDYLASREFTLGVGLLERKQTDLFNDNMESTSVNEFFSYNGRNQLRSKKVVNSDNKTIETSYFYPEIIPNEPTPDVIQKMLAKNIISPVIKSTTEVGTTLQMKETHGSRVDYKEFIVGDSKILTPAQSFELEVKPSGNAYVPKDEVLSYSVNGNPLEYVSKDGIRSSLIWGYNDRYMVVKADNMDSVALAGHIAASLPSGFSTLEALLGSFTVLPDTNWDQFNHNLRTRVASTNTMVTTYTYSPLLGITSSTDLNNISSYYYYDSFGRLERLKDHEGNIVQQYEYHYQNQ